MTAIPIDRSGLTASPTAASTRWLVLGGALIIQLILGTVYGYSVFWQPLEARWFPPVLTEAEAKARIEAGQEVTAGAVIVPDAAAAERERAVRQGYLKYAFGICLLSFATSMVLAGRIQDVRGPRVTATIGGVLLGSGFLVASRLQYEVTFQIAHAVLMGLVVVAALGVYEVLFPRAAERSHPLIRHLPLGVATFVIVAGVGLAQRHVHGDTTGRLLLFWATVGLLAGIGIGFAYVSPIAALVKWFPQHKGLVSGIAVAGFGFGAFLFSGKSVLGAVGFIERYGIETFFGVHGLVCLLAVCGGALLLRNPPQVQQVQASGSAAVGPELTWQELLRSPAFYVIWLMFFSGALAGLMVIGILKPFAGAQLVAAASAGGAALDEATTRELLARGAGAVGVLAIFNALGRIFWGLASDRAGRTAALTAMFLLQALMLLMLTNLRSEWSLAVGAAWVGFNFGGNFALFPSLTADLFGTRNLGANYGWVFTSYGLAGVSGVALGNAAMQWTGSYFAAFAIAAALCVLSALLALGLPAVRARWRPMAAAA
jgi:OFA family oxalate/formate antiporter-like MFS transporter